MLYKQKKVARIQQKKLTVLCFSCIVLQQSMMLEADGGSLSPGTKPHICDHCTASFRSSYHLRRHVLIHTGTYFHQRVNIFSTAHKEFDCILCEQHKQKNNVINTIMNKVI